MVMGEGLVVCAKEDVADCELGAEDVPRLPEVVRRVEDVVSRPARRGRVLADEAMCAVDREPTLAAGGVEDGENVALGTSLVL